MSAFALCVFLLAADEPSNVAAKIQKAVQDLKEGDLNQRRSAARALAGLSRRAAPAVPAMIEALQDEPDRQARWMLLFGLGRIGPAAAPLVPAIFKALGRMEGATPPYVTSELFANLGPAAIPHLIEALENPDGRVREIAASVLGKIGPPAKAATPALVRLTRDPFYPVRSAAIRALDEIDGAQTDAAQTDAATLMKIINEGDYQLQPAAVIALGDTGDSAHVPFLVSLLRKGRCRRSCVIALATLGPSAAPPMINALERNEIALDAVKVLGKLAP
ncbi:MAG: HEAT repeat domain-containing protein, partial [Planctomycetales bacterium]